jgi:hypothetical protein
LVQEEVSRRQLRYELPGAGRIGDAFGDAELAYMARLRERGWRRALDVCQATWRWWTSQLHPRADDSTAWRSATG